MKKILIVEDDINLLNLYKEVLQEDGYEIELAEDGEQAIKKAQAFIPDVILLDLMLPTVDGFEVLKTVKADPATKDTLVIIQTNLDSEFQRDKAINLGAAEFLVKADDDPGKLLSEVKAIISKN